MSLNVDIFVHDLSNYLNSLGVNADTGP